MARRTHKKSKSPLLLTEWMEEQGETDVTLAKALGVSRETVWKWQASSTRLNPTKQAQVASALRIWPALLWVHPGTPMAKMMAALFEMNAPATAAPERKIARK